MKRYLLGSLAIVTVVLSGALAGCSKEDSASFNDADVTFTQGMIPHHQQAVEMAKMANTQAASAKVKDLAQRIEAAQGPEIEKMQAWLKDWGKSQKASGDAVAGMHMGTAMMSAADMEQLGAAKGAAFDKRFLTMMVGHHEGAVEMAKTELKDGKASEAKTLARAIITAQEREITEMKGLEATA